MDKSYRYTAKTGDLVRMQNGTLAIISDWDIICGGNVKEVKLFPFTSWVHRIWLFWTDKLTVCEEDIDKLELVRAS